MRYASLRHAPLLAATAVAAVVTRAAPIAAQETAAGAVPAPVMAAAAAIGAADIARHVGVITADSIKGRGTPSAGLEAVARYVAAEFGKVGVRPGGDLTRKLDSTGQIYRAANGEWAVDTSYVQRYPMLGNARVSHQASRLNLVVKLRKKDKVVVNDESWPIEKSFGVSFERDGYFGVDTVPQSGALGNWGGMAPPLVTVFAGPHTPQSVRQAKPQDKLVLYVPDARADSATRRQIFELLYASNHVLVVSGDDSATFAARRNAAAARRTLAVDRYMEEELGIRHWGAYVRADAVERFLAVAGVDLAGSRALATPMVRELPSFRAAVEVGVEAADSVTAVNAVGVVEGSDTVLRHQYVIYSAHMDHASAGDAPDNAAGVAALLEVAKAFSRPGARPKRSVLFIATSGGAEHFSGANYFVANPPGWGVDGLAMNVKLGAIGRRSPGSVTIAGLTDVEVAARPDWIAARHPDLKLTAEDGGLIPTADADHLAFVRKAVPSYYFYNEAEAEPAGTKVDADHAARIARLAFLFGEEIANAERRPRWTAVGRRERVRYLGQ